MTALSSDLRRRLLKAAGAFFSLHALGIGFAEAASSPSKLERATFAAFLNVLIPRDALSGSATDLGVDAKLWLFSQHDPQYRHLLELGCLWLNQTGGPAFSELSEGQRIAVTRWMSTSDWNQVPRRFYELTRQLAIETYYSDPASWAGLPLQRPPQPFGYPPPWQ